MGMRVTVYCSATSGLPEKWREGAITTGRCIGMAGAKLVYGGVESGLMEVVAKATHEAGGEVVGVVPSRRKDMASKYIDVMIQSPDLGHRKEVMQTLGDVFVALPGGYGTLDELASTFAQLNFTDQKRPIVVFNPDGVFDPFFAQLQLMVKNGLMHPSKLDILHPATELKELETLLTDLLK